MQNKFITQIKNSLTKTGEYPEHIEGTGMILSQSYHLKQFLESVFGKGSVIVAYDKGSRFTKGNWDMGCCSCVFVTRTGSVIETTNSEWGDMSKVGKIRLD